MNTKSPEKCMCKMALANKARNKDEDDDESIREECWVSHSKNDSRKWLIRDASYKKIKQPLCSTMRATYTYPYFQEKGTENIGDRKASLLKKFQEEAEEEVLREQNPKPEIEDYCTEYDSNFQSENFVSNEESFLENKEEYLKYPLYSSPATSYYSFNLKKRPQEVLHGHTKTTDPQNPFRKCAGFSKPIHEVLDEGIF